MRSIEAAFAALSVLLAPVPGAGISARFGEIFFVEGHDLRVDIEVLDKTSAVRRVVVDVRGPEGARPWRTLDAEPAYRGGWWHATLTSSVARSLAPILEVRARILGARGGTLLSLAEHDPFRVEMIRARAHRNSLESSSEPGTRLLGSLGVDGRLGATSATMRAFVGVAAPLDRRREIAVYLSVGPAVAELRALEGGGPIVLGLEGGFRALREDLNVAFVSFFLEPFGFLDLRFPGVDPGLGLRAGFDLHLDQDAAFEISLGGALGEAIRGPHLLGVAGVVRAGLRFGSSHE